MTTVTKIVTSAMNFSAQVTDMRTYDHVFLTKARTLSPRAGPAVEVSDLTFNARAAAQRATLPSAMPHHASDARP